MTRTAVRYTTALCLAGALALVVVASRTARGEHAAVQVPDVASTVAPPGAPLDTAIFAGGCFWGIEAVYEHLVGVSDVVSGYSGGSVVSPSYEQVSSGRTGHAESVRVIYDPSRITYGQLLQVFFAVAHDPTQLNRQGPDTGTQYRSAIFYRTPEQKAAADAYIAQLTKAKTYSAKIVTEVTPLKAFYLAEDYHQNFMAHNPTDMYIVINDAPKVAHLRTQFPALYREPVAP